MSPARARLALLLLMPLALAACGSQVASRPDTAAVTATTSSSSQAATASAASASASASATAGSSVTATHGSYVDYAKYAANRDMYAAGKVVLFFHADWCPKCRETDANLTADPASIPAGLTIVKADFDSETDLRQKYGVTVQHTFVQVDNQGGQLAKWTGTFAGGDIAGKTV